MRARVTGHFGEWVQGRLGQDGPLVLLTVPCPALYVEVTRDADGELVLRQPEPLLDPARARAFLNAIGGQTGTYSVTSNMPVGGGAGSSTAALIALARASGGDETQLIRACLQAEGASDPLMLDAPETALWASREGQIIAKLPRLPAAEIVGGFWGPPTKTDPDDQRFPDVSDLAQALETLMTLGALAKIATTSALRCTELRGPDDDPTHSLAETLGALGFLRAHTGSARGFIFAPGTVPDTAAALLRTHGYTGILQFQTRGHA